jgi:hypothetical protein
VRVFNLPANSGDITTLVTGIKGHGFTSLQWHKEKINPPAWLRPEWRGNNGVYCSRCSEQIGVLPRSYKTGGQTVTGAPYIFCACVRLRPSRLPDPAFFTDNWDRVLRVSDLLEACALEFKNA